MHIPMWPIASSTIISINKERSLMILTRWWCSSPFHPKETIFLLLLKVDLHAYACVCVCVCVLSLYILSFRFIHDALCIHHSFIFIGFHFLKIYPCLLIDNCVVAMLTISDRGNCFLYMLGTYIFIFTG